MEETGSAQALVTAPKSVVVNENCAVKPKSKQYKRDSLVKTASADAGGGDSGGGGGGGGGGGEQPPSQDNHSSNHNPPNMHPDAQNSPGDGADKDLPYGGSKSFSQRFVLRMSDRVHETVIDVLLS